RYRRYNGWIQVGNTSDGQTTYSVVCPDVFTNYYLLSTDDDFVFVYSDKNDKVIRSISRTDLKSRAWEERVTKLKILHMEFSAFRSFMMAWIDKLHDSGSVRSLNKQFTWDNHDVISLGDRVYHPDGRVDEAWVANKSDLAGFIEQQGTLDQWRDA